MILLKFLVAGLAMFCIVVAVMYFAQRTLMYLPERQRVSPADAGLPNVEEIVLDTADGEKVMAQMKATPINDFEMKNVTIRADGTTLRPMYLVQVKKPTESKAPYDVYNVLSTVDPGEVWRTPAEAGCPFVKP